MAIRYIILIALAGLLKSNVFAAPFAGVAPDYMLLNDTIDEEDLQALRDTMHMSRLNLAKEKKDLNLQDYVIKDTYTPTHHSFSKAWYEHIYVGGSLGIEQFVPRVDDYKYRFFSNISLYVGKQINRTNGLRLGLGYGWGYEKTDNSYLNRITAKLDYLYNLSTHFQGYNPARPVEISLMQSHISNGFYNTAINRMYYACYYAASALLIANKITTKSHDGVRQMFSLHFVKTGKIPKEYSRFYGNLFQKRTTGDYEDLFNQDLTTCETFYPTAKDFVSVVGHLVDEWLAQAEQS